MDYLELNEYYLEGGQDIWKYIEENDLYIEFFEFLSRIPEDNARALIYKGHLMDPKISNPYFKGNVKKQLGYYQKAYDLAPNDSWINYHIGEWYYNEKNYKKALQYLVNVSKTIKAHLKLLIECYVHNDDNKNAILMDFKYFQLYGESICNLKAIKKQNEKINIYKQCYQENPEKAVKYFANITVIIPLSRYVEMQEEIEALKLCPGSLEYQKARKRFQKLNLCDKDKENNEPGCP